MPMVEFCIKVARDQDSNNKYFIIKNPSASAMWSHPDMKGLYSIVPGLARINIHMCCYGLVDPVSGIPMRKSKVYSTTCPLDQ